MDFLRRLIFSLRRWITLENNSSNAPIESADQLRLFLNKSIERLYSTEVLCSYGLKKPATETLCKTVKELCVAQQRWPVLASTCEPVFKELNIDCKLIIESDEDSLQQWAEKLRSLRRTAVLLARSLSPLQIQLLPLWQRSSLRVFRSLMMVSLFAAIGLFAFRVFGPQVRATASASYGSLYPPWHVTDYDMGSNWLLPDGAHGWIELTIPSKKLYELQLWNVQNMGNYATTGCAIEVFNGTTLVQRSVHDLSATVGKSIPFTFTPATALNATRVRVQVTTFSGYGGGFSQIVVNP